MVIWTAPGLGGISRQNCSPVTKDKAAQFPAYLKAAAHRTHGSVNLVVRTQVRGNKRVSSPRATARSRIECAPGRKSARRSTSFRFASSRVSSGCTDATFAANREAVPGLAQSVEETRLDGRDPSRTPDPKLRSRLMITLL